MADGTITEKEYAKWLTPQEALKRVAGAGQDWQRAAEDILRRAVIGKILVCAEEVHITKGPKSWHLARFSGLPVNVLNHWASGQRHANLSFWNSSGGDGDATVSTSGDTLSSQKKKYLLIGIRFEPEGINKLAGSPAAALGATFPDAPIRAPVLPATTQAQERDTKLPPLSAAALKAWYEAYKLAYTASERNLDHAWSRAKTAFPDKAVTRQAVRALMPGGKPGPRSKG